MPVINSAFQPPLWLTNRHVQTILPVLLRRVSRPPFEREQLELSDGDFLHLDWLRQPTSSRLAILSHGLEGSSSAIYIRSIAATLYDAGWSVLAWSYRGCSGEPNRLLRSYHSGASEDLRFVVDHAAGLIAQSHQSLDPAASHTLSELSIALVGFSLGGNITLKYLGETPPHPAVKKAVCISVPIDLAASAQVIDQLPSNALYLNRFLKTMRLKLIEKDRAFPGSLDLHGLASIRTFREFDERFTAPLNGFKSVDDYWARASSKPLLSNIKVPTLLLSAQDDPFLPTECFPMAEAEASDHLFLEAPTFGGHVGFLDFNQYFRPWSEPRTLAFLGESSKQAS
jgi:predicted alpha/beta-fold hydrolase